ncbi:MAG TPA: class I SAM-dependent methyltransferase [Ktedonobacterales bacterium]
MDASLSALLAELEEAGRLNDEREPERSKKMLNLEPETARLISILLRSSRRTRLLEIGTSNGYSTIWLAWAMCITGGHVTSIDREAEKQRLADGNLRRAGLREFVELRQGGCNKYCSGFVRPI